MARIKNNVRHRATEDAQEIFSVGGNQLKLTLCVVLCVAITILVWLLSDFAEIAFLIFDVDLGEILPYIASRILLCLLVLFLASPVYVGTFGLAMRMLRGEKVEAVDAFDTFSSHKAYGRALRISLNLFLRILPLIILLRLPYMLDMLAYYLVFPAFVYEYSWVAVIIAFPIVALPVSASFGFISFSYLDKNESVRVCVHKARKARRGNYRAIYSLAYVTLFKLLLSLLTVGVWTVIHTIPMALLSYASLATELKKLSERTDINGTQ